MLMESVKFSRLHNVVEDEGCDECGEETSSMQCKWRVGLQIVAKEWMNQFRNYI